MIRKYNKNMYDKYRCERQVKKFELPCRRTAITPAIIHEWLWRQIKSLDAGWFQQEIIPDPQLVLNLAAVRRELARTERTFEELSSHPGDFLRPYVDQAARQKQQLEK